MIKLKLPTQKWRNSLAPVLFMVTSCTVTEAPHYMYAPRAVNVPMFTQKDQSDVNLKLSYYGIDAQAGYAISDHLAMVSSWYWRNEYHYDKDFHHVPHSHDRMDSIHSKRKAFSFGISYYSPLNKRKNIIINGTAGFGIGRFSMNSSSQTKVFFPSQDSLIAKKLFNYDTQMKQFFLEPAIVFDKGKRRAAFSVRWSGIVYNKVVNSTSNPDEYGKISNRLLSFIEPAYTYELFLNGWLHLALQLGASLNTQEIDYQYRPIIANIGIGIDPVKLYRKR